MDLFSAVSGTPPSRAHALAILRDDHGELRRLLDDYEASVARAPDACASLSEQICMQWELHDRLEREIFYPAVQALAASEWHVACARHAEIDECVRTLRLRPATGERERAMRKLGALARAHMDEEEASLYTLAERLPGDRLEAMGRDMLRRREELAGSADEVESRS